MKQLLLVPLLALLLVSASVHAATYVVKPDGTGDFPTIQTAVDVAEDGDIIELADGTFTGDGNRDIDYMGKAITVRSQSGDPGTCLIDCEFRGRGFIFRSGEGSDSEVMGLAVAQGAAFESGWPDDSGGGLICLEGTSPTVRKCNFVGNGARYAGGAVYCYRASPILEGCVFEGNSTGISSGQPNGGAMSCYQSFPVLNQCTFSLFNLSVYGGGLSLDAASEATLTGCTFSFNIAPSGGGGIYSDGSILSLVSCTFHYNSGSHIFLTGASSGWLENTVVAFSFDEEAIRCEGASESVNLGCCDVFGNGGGDWVGCIADQYGINGNISEDPLFCDPEDGDFTIRSDSPCAPFSPPNEECDLIGAWPVGCEPPTATMETSWGRIKARFGE